MASKTYIAVDSPPERTHMNTSRLSGASAAAFASDSRRNSGPTKSTTALGAACAIGPTMGARRSLRVCRRNIAQPMNAASGIRLKKASNAIALAASSA